MNSKDAVIYIIFTAEHIFKLNILYFGIKILKFILYLIGKRSIFFHPRQFNYFFKTFRFLVHILPENYPTLQSLDILQHLLRTHLIIPEFGFSSKMPKVVYFRYFIIDVKD